MNILARARTDATVRRARVVAVLVLLAVVVFGAARPALTGRGAASRAGPHAESGVATVSVVVLAAGVAVLLLGAILWWRPRRRLREPDHTRREVLPLTRLERVVTVLGALLILGLVGVAVWQVVRLAGPPAHVTPTVPGTPPPPTGRPAPAGHGVSGTVFLVVGGAALAVLLAAGAVALLRQHRRAAPAVTASGATAGLAEAVAAGRSALRSTTGDIDGHRAAILACYAAMEQRLARAGLARAEADTPSEHLRRAIDAGVLRAEPADALLTLFHRARFSDHAMGVGDRRAAEQALDGIAHELREAR